MRVVGKTRRRRTYPKTRTGDLMITSLAIGSPLFSPGGQDPSAAIILWDTRSIEEIPCGCVWITSDSGPLFR
jgi:hypothetical protein